jgi:hypothetical protein
MDPSPQAHPGLMRKFIRRTTISLLLLGVVLFGSAGTLRWQAAWVYLAFAAAISFPGGFWLAGHDPGLLKERLGSLIQRGQKGWDKLLMVVMLTLWLSWLVLMGSMPSAIIGPTFRSMPRLSASSCSALAVTSSG